MLQILVYGIIVKNGFNIALAVLLLMMILIAFSNKKGYEVKHFKIIIITNVIMILLCIYYFIRLSGISNLIIDYILEGLLLVYFLYVTLDMIVLRKIREKNHIRKLMNSSEENI